MKKKTAFTKLKTWTAKDVFRDTRVLVRIDANIPLKEGRVSADGLHRLFAVAPEIERLQSRGARIILLAHLGDPAGRKKAALSLAPVARALSRIVESPVRFIPHGPGDAARKVIDRMAPGTIIMLENLRFDSGEEKNATSFAKELAACADVYVNNAFGVCHRKHASVVAITKYLPSFAGELVMREVRALSIVPKHPFVLVFGGAKISTKIPLMKKFGGEADAMLLGGGASLTMLHADTGSLPVAAPQFIKKTDVARARSVAKKFGEIIHLPCDVAVHGGTIIDVGPSTIEAFCNIIGQAKMIVWNGPLGITERKDGRAATLAIAQVIAENRRAISIIGGGETVEFLEKHHLVDDFTHVSTGGGAMLAFLGGDAMPGLEALQ
jgi:3-phosphoglycerate kinase